MTRRASRAPDRPYVETPPYSVQKFIDAGIGTKSDTLVAKACGVTRARVQQIRKKLGLASHRDVRWEKAKAWLRAQADLTGAKTWKALVTEFNAAHGTNVTQGFLRRLALEADLSKPNSPPPKPNLGKRLYAPDSMLFDLVAKGVQYSEIKVLLGIPENINIGAAVYRARRDGRLPAAVEAGRAERRVRGIRKAHAATGLTRKATFEELRAALAEGNTVVQIRARFGYKTYAGAASAVQRARKGAAGVPALTAQKTKGKDE